MRTSASTRDRLTRCAGGSAMTDDDRRAGRGGERQRVLEADPALGLAGRDERLGRVVRVGQDLEVDRRVARTSPSRGRRRTRCGWCSASSRARTGPCPGGPASRARPTPATDGATGEADAVDGGAGDGLGVAASRSRRRRARRRRAREDAFMDSTSGSITERRRPRKPGRRIESMGLLPSLVRARSGSAGLWPWPHSQRARAPRRRYSVAASLAPCCQLPGAR